MSFIFYVGNIGIRYGHVIEINVSLYFPSIRFVVIFIRMHRVSEKNV